MGLYEEEGGGSGGGRLKPFFHAAILAPNAWIKAFLGAQNYFKIVDGSRYGREIRIFFLSFSLLYSHRLSSPLSLSLSHSLYFFISISIFCLSYLCLTKMCKKL